MTVSSSAQISAKPGFFRPFWSWKHCPPWLIALLAMMILGGMRVYAMLGPPAAQALYLVYCVATCCLPFFLLSSAGRAEIGLDPKETSKVSIACCALAGAGYAVFFFCAGQFIYGNSPENWDLSIRAYLRIEDLRGLMPPAAIVALYLIPALTLTPVGEEMLFRGVVQQAFARRWGVLVGALVNSLGYGLVYSYVHAIWRDSSGLHLRLHSGCVGALLMAGAGTVYTVCRIRTRNLPAAMVAHAAFNVAMVALVVYFSPL
jgi:membrane protease YdiL (CAAX protease family)